MKIPRLTARGDLYKKLIINILGGFWNVLGPEGKRYFHLLCILIDKSVYEFNIAVNYIKKEIKHRDSLAYKLKIIGHLENCINSIGGADRILKIITNGIYRKGELVKKDQKNIKVYKKDILSIINSQKISVIRNRIEHIDEDIFDNKIKGPLLLQIDSEYEKILINNQSIRISDIIILIESFEKLVVTMQEKMPFQIDKNFYYYMDGRREKIIE